MAGSPSRERLLLLCLVFIDAHTDFSLVTPVRWMASCSLMTGRSLHRMQIGFTYAVGRTEPAMVATPAVPMVQKEMTGPSMPAGRMSRYPTAALATTRAAPRAMPPLPG